MKHIFVVNPAAGKTNAFQVLQNELESNYKGVLDYEIYQTRAPRDATVYIRDYCHTHTEPVRFYACGGDGTLNEVANGIVGFSHASMSCYPCGSGNDYVKYYGGKKAFLNVRALIEGEETRIDLMRVGDRYAINATHFGFDSSVASIMQSVRRKKVIGGKNAYTTGIVVSLFKAMKNKCRVYADGKLLNPKGVILLCTVANGQYVGGSFRCAPRSVNNDGKLEVCLVHPVSYFKFMNLIKYYTEGLHLSDPKFEKVLEYCRAERVEIEAPDGFLYSFDGELIQDSHFTVEVVPRAIRFALPKGAKPIVDPQYVTEEETTVEV
ncbi:MAG: hypothetical protein E7620_03845 [Ruminococcaceae bacterium]|nr:hypothetical protein [Oscillospiraceae bacterium]